MLVYCDYIAAIIHEKIKGDIDSVDTVIKNVSSIEWDLHPDGGYMVSTKKTILVQDKGGKTYKVTVEEL